MIAYRAASRAIFPFKVIKILATKHTNFLNLIFFKNLDNFSPLLRPTELTPARNVRIQKVKLNSSLTNLKKLRKRELPLLLIAVNLILGLRVLSLICQVKLHTVKNHRIGHFCENTEISHLSAIKEQRDFQGRKKRIDIYCFQVPTSSNSFLEKMWKRKLFCLNAPLGQFVYDSGKKLFPGAICKSINDDIEHLRLNVPPVLSFKKSELIKGNEFLKRLEVLFSNKFICLNVRDSRFLASSPNIGWKRSRDWSYSDHRNSEITSFVLAAETLAEMGYTVFRMGALVKEPLISKHPRVFDYATNGMRTEFLDIFLGAHCSFTVSTGSGWDSIPIIFRRPLLYVNFLPLGNPSLHLNDCYFYLKTLHLRDSKTPLLLRDLDRMNLLQCFDSHIYKDAGVVIRDLSSDELVDAVTEMAQRVEGTFVETPEQKEMQAKAKHILSTHPKLQPTPNYYPIRAQFASCFLSRYPNFLD